MVKSIFQQNYIHNNTKTEAQKTMPRLLKCHFPCFPFLVYRPLSVHTRNGRSIFFSYLFKSSFDMFLTLRSEVQNKLPFYLYKKLFVSVIFNTPLPLWSSGKGSWLQIQRSRVRSSGLPDFLRSSGSRTGSTQLREDN
jgi:hypothetical protein